MKRTITRRGLMVSAAMTAALPATVAEAQSTPEQTDLAKAARDQNQRIGEVLAKFEIPLSTEPAFQFKA